MLIRDRIQDFRRVSASTLLPNPKNWRVHNDRQRNILRGILAEIGYADALLVRNGRLILFTRECIEDFLNQHHKPIDLKS